MKIFCPRLVVLLGYCFVADAFCPQSMTRLTTTSSRVEECVLMTTNTGALFLAANDETNSDRQSSTQQQQQQQKAKAVVSPVLYRDVVHIEKYARLPVWPAWNGVLLWMVGKLLGPTVAAKLEDVITGRVCPNFFQDDGDSTSPFIMLVHHCHTFAPIDPLRYFQKLFFPEGFPAHPHRGFVTLTYFLDGGFLHRDSLGIEQVYGQNLQGVKHHSQWLSTGAGLLHEEMFAQNAWWHWQRQELYQLWINLPSGAKMSQPYLLLLSDETETPVLRTDKGVMCRVLAGRFDAQHQAKVPTASDLTVMHVALDSPGTSSWTYRVPELYETLIVYVRKGTLAVTGNDNAAVEIIPAHHTAFFSRQGRQLHVTAKEANTDFMLLAGVSLKEPVSSQGSMVMNYPDEINQAYRDYQVGLFGRPWPHTLSRQEWQTHVQQNPSAYRAVDGKDTTTSSQSN